MLHGNCANSVLSAASRTCSAEMCHDGGRHEIALHAQILHLCVFKLLLHLFLCVVLQQPPVAELARNLVSVEPYRLSTGRGLSDIVSDGTGDNGAAWLLLLHGGRSCGSGLSSDLARSFSPDFLIEIGPPICDSMVDLVLVGL